jgi:hypothetical protein
MLNAKSSNKTLAAGELKTDKPAPLTAQDVRRIVEEILSQHHAASQNEFIGFDELVTRLPLGARTLRAQIRNGRIPAIILPGGRRLLFSWEAVRLSLIRFSKGGIE